MHYLTESFYKTPHIARTTMTKKELQATLIHTEGVIRANCRMWNIVSTHMDVGIYKVTLKQMNDVRNTTMEKEEFVEIKERIVKTEHGAESTKSIIAKSPNLSENFMHMMWNDYLIDIQEIEEKQRENCMASDEFTEHDDLNHSERGH